jgi:hypothetical protein
MKRSLKDLSQPELIKVADKWFSYFIRLRDSDSNGYCLCCTCGHVQYWKHLDCGHYSKRNKAHRFNEKNCHAQCKYCNNYMKGEADKHAQHINKLYGEGTAELLRGTENKLRNLNRLQLITMIEEYKLRAKNIGKVKHLKIGASNEQYRQRDKQFHK